MFNRRQLRVLESRPSSLCLGKFSFVVVNSNMFVYYKYVLQLDYLWKNKFSITYLCLTRRILPYNIHIDQKPKYIWKKP